MSFELMFWPPEKDFIFDPCLRRDKHFRFYIFWDYTRFFAKVKRFFDYFQISFGYFVSI